jgi:hypothetical protein
VFLARRLEAGPIQDLAQVVGEILVRAPAAEEILVRAPVGVAAVVQTAAVVRSETSSLPLELRGWSLAYS